MSKCSICGAHLDTAGACPNGWRSGHPEWPKPLPTPLPPPKPVPTAQQLPEYFSSTPAILEVLGEIRDLLRELVESHTREGK